MDETTLKRIVPRASRAVIDLNCSTSGSVMECGPGPRALAKKASQNSDTGIYIVRVTSYRNRLCDEDNLCEKFHVDACRYAGILPSDAPDKAHIIVTQKKVATKKEQKTLIEIDLITPTIEMRQQ